MKKTRVATRLKQKTNFTKTRNRSNDLVALRNQYTLHSKKLKFLMLALKANHVAMIASSRAKLEVAKAVNGLTADTPMFDIAGRTPNSAPSSGEPTSVMADPSSYSANGNSTAIVNAAPPAGDLLSYASLHISLNDKVKHYHEKYIEHVLKYTAEWDRVTSTRINANLKQTEKLRVDLDHYQKKVEDMRKSANSTLSKGKSVKEDTVSKLNRNEIKLVNSKKEYDRFVADLCALIEEVTERGWKDLHPLLVKVCQFDSAMSSEEAGIMRGMNEVVGKLKELAQRTGVKEEGRLKELENWNPAAANANNAGVGASGGGPGFLEEGAMGGASGGGYDGYDRNRTDSSEGELAGVGGGGLFGDTNNMNTISGGSSASPLHAGGVGGPRLSRNDSYNSQNGDSWNGGEVATGAPRSRNNSSDGNGQITPSAPRRFSGTPYDLSQTSGMLAVAQAAAPPPTLDDIFGSAPPMAQQAPAGMPPPPPSMPPPPPPPGSMLMHSSMQQPPTSGMSALSIYPPQQHMQSHMSMTSPTAPMRPPLHNSGSSSSFGASASSMGQQAPPPQAAYGGHASQAAFGSQQSLGSSSSNPFDDGPPAAPQQQYPYGVGGGGGQPPSLGNPYGAGPHGASPPPQSPNNAYGFGQPPSPGNPF